MKTIKSLILSTIVSTALLFPAIAAAQEIRPLLTITAQNFDRMVEASMHIQRAIEPKKPLDLRQEFLSQAGNPDGVGLDSSRPWHFSFWFSGIGMPTYSVLYVPVADFEAFKDALKPGKNFKGFHNNNIIRKDGKYAVIINRPKKDFEIPEAVTKAAVQLRRTLPKTIGTVFQLNLGIDENMRKLLLGGLQMGRGMLQMQMANPKGKAQNAATPFDALADVFGLYFDVAALIVKGVENLQLNVDIDRQQITTTTRLDAVDGSELATMLAPTKANLNRFAPYLNNDSAMVFVGHVRGSEFTRGLIAKAMAVSAKLQGGDGGEKASKQMNEIMGKLLPMTFAGSFDMGPGFRISGIYEFPDNKANDIHEEFGGLMESMTQIQVGKDGLYSSFKREKAARKVKGATVDIVTTTINTNSAMLKLPGQLEAFRIMWPEDKITYEFATKGRRIFYSMGEPIEVAMAKAKSPAKLRVSINKNTFVAGRYNILALMKTWMPQNPMMPKEIMGPIGKLDHKDTGIDLKADIDGQLSSQTVVPLKLLTQFSRFGKEIAKGRQKAKPAEVVPAPPEAKRSNN